MVSPRGGPAIPSARRSDEPPAAAPLPDGAAVRTEAPAPARRRLTWDIPWLGGRSTAPWVVLATVVILVLAALGALYAEHKPSRLGFTAVKYVDRSDNAVDFTFSVYKSPKAVAACDISAADDAGGVGTLNGVIVPARPDGGENTSLTVTVRTIRRAQTAVLEGCHIVSTG